jgi:hypothetical protein
MLTITLAWINAKYKHDYDLLFVGTFIIDLEIIGELVKFL